MIIAIDGPAGSGKSTIARAIAERFGITKLDTGAMYRAVTLAALNRHVDLDDEAAVEALASAISITYPRDAPGHIAVDGTDVTRAIRTPEVDARVSKVSAYPGVRRAMVALQRAVADDHDLVAEGRDIGTVVFPAAEVKVFLTADPRERARRRVLQRHEHDAVDQATLDSEVAETLAAIIRRDDLDAHRDVAPLVAAADAVTIDSTAYTIDDVVDQIARLIDERR